MKRFIVILSLFTICFTQDVVQNITASQRTDGSRIIDIYYDLSSHPDYPSFQILLQMISFEEIWGGDEAMAYSQNISMGLKGDIGDNIFPGNQKHITMDLKHLQCRYTDISYIGANLCHQHIGMPGNGCDPYTFIEQDEFDDNYWESTIHITAIGSQFINETPFEMELVAAGEFTQGPGDTIKVIDYDYMMSKYEITNEEYLVYLTESFDDIHESDMENYPPNLPNLQTTLIDNFAIGYLNYPGNGQSYQDICRLEAVMGYYPGDQWEKPGVKPLYILGFDDGVSQCYANGFFLSDSHVDARAIKREGDVYTLRDQNLSDHPVVGVTYWGAWHFAHYYGMRLPTNDEWEKAARGMTGSNWWNSSGASCQLGNVMNEEYSNPYMLGCECAPIDSLLWTAPVGTWNGSEENASCTGNQFLYDVQSPYGMYDMTGNAAEYIDGYLPYELRPEYSPGGNNTISNYNFYELLLPSNGNSTYEEITEICSESYPEVDLPYIGDYAMPLHKTKSGRFPSNSPHWAVIGEWFDSHYDRNARNGIRCVITVP